MEIREIIKIYLKEKGYDGLVNIDCECACIIVDLFPCDLIDAGSCEAGYCVPCDCGEHDFHINLKKPEKN